MFDFTQHLTTRLRRLVTAQAEPIPGTTQVANSAGGYAWDVGHWRRLDRFLILGTEGGTFYIGERQLTREGAASVEACIREDGARVVRRVVEISEAGRAASLLLSPGGGLKCTLHPPMDRRKAVVDPREQRRIRCLSPLVH